MSLVKQTPTDDSRNRTKRFDTIIIPESRHVTASLGPEAKICPMLSRVSCFVAEGITTGSPNGPVLSCSLSSVVGVCCRRLSSVTLPAGLPPGACGQYGYVPLKRHLVF